MFVQGVEGYVVKYGEIVLVEDRLTELLVLFPWKALNAVLTSLAMQDRAV